MAKPMGSREEEDRIAEIVAEKTAHLLRRLGEIEQRLDSVVDLILSSTVPSKLN
jgi:hypothetical protein